MELRLVIELATAEAVADEWRNLTAGGAFVKGATATQDQACLLVLQGPHGAPLELAARAVYCGPTGVGVEVLGFAALRERVEAWKDAQSAPKPEPEATQRRMEPDSASDADSDPDNDPAADPDAEPDEEELRRDPLARNVFQRLRGLTVAAQLKVARDSDIPAERMALERMYGKIVWEALLRNTRVSTPEVARISRMGTLPRPLLEMIVANTAWLRSPEVRRALLANKRLAADMIARVLRILPKHELRLVPAQTAYPASVRDVARKLLKPDQ